MSTTDYLDTLRQKISSWDESIEQLKASASQSDAAAQKEYNRQIAAIKEKRENVATQLREVESASGQKWDELVQKLTDTVHDVESRIAKALGK